MHENFQKRLFQNIVWIKKLSFQVKRELTAFQIVKLYKIECKIPNIVS
jgi:hypothetical protein